MERIDREIKRTLSRTGGGEGALLAEITAVWPEVVGEAIARNAWPMRRGRDGTLHVATSSATWAFELDRMSVAIDERLRATLGEVAPERLRFRVGPVPEPGAAPSGDPAESPGEPPEVSREAAAAATAAAAEVEDPELRELVARAARASLSKPSSDRGFW